MEEFQTGFLVKNIGDGKLTAGGSGITESCESYFKELGYNEYVPFKEGMVIPGEVILDVLSAVMDAKVQQVEETFPDQTFTQNQVEALVSVIYNFGHIPDSLKEAISKNSNIKETWIHLSDSQAEKWPGLPKRREAEYILFSEGKYIDTSSKKEIQFASSTPFSDLINGKEPLK